jgi:hypothetical protein
MKKNLRIKPSAPVLLGAMLALTAVQGSSPDRVGKYDFSYESQGDVRAKPVQVFDDGSSTFFQFRAGEALPTILAATTAGPQLMVPKIEGPYARVDGVSGQYILKSGLSTSNVSYLGSGRAAPNAPGATPGQSGADQAAMARLVAAAGQIHGGRAEFAAQSPRVDLHVDSYATPLRGDRVQWTTTEVPSTPASIPFVLGKHTAGPQATRQVRDFARTIASAQRVVITGIDDRSYAEGLAEKRAQAVADLLVAAGIARDRIAIKSSAQPLEEAGQSVVTGASVIGYTRQTIAHAATQSSGPTATAALAAKDAMLSRVVAQLRSGELTPNQASEAIERARNAAPGQMPAAAPTLGRWEVRVSDENVNAMLKRWGAASGWRVVVEGAPEIKIHGDAIVERPTFLQAADYAISQAKGAGYSIKASAFTNNVLLLTAGDQK